MTADAPSIVLIGATGFTGRLVAEELHRLGAPFVIAGRDGNKLDALAADLGGTATARLVDVRDSDALRAILEPGDVVINCAGPFGQLGEPVVHACIEAGAHYTDITGEQGFMRRILARYGESALAAGVTVAPAMAFEYALSDCAAALAGAGMARPLRSVDVIYSWQRPATSRGTRRTMLRGLGQRGVILERGELSRRPHGAERRLVSISGGPRRAVLFTSGEVVTIPRHLDVETVRGWMVTGATTARLAPLISPMLPFLVSVSRPLLAVLVRRRPDPDPARREANRFTIRVELHGRTGVRSAVEIRGRDPYGITAEVVTAAARRILEPDAPRGVLAPAQLMTPRPFLAALSRRWLTLVENA